MIEIKINNITLPLPVGLQMTRDIETTILNREASVTDFTYPVDIPLTDEAIIALGYPHSLANPNLKNEFLADYIVDGIYVDQVTVKILQVSLKNKVASVSLIGKYGSFARILNGKKVTDLVLGGDRTIGTLDPSSVGDDHYYFTTFELHYRGCNSHVFMKQIITGAIIDDYVFGMSYDDAPDSNVVMEAGSRNVINAWSYVGRRAVAFPIIPEFLDPVYHNIINSCHGFEMTSLYENPHRYWWIPQFRLHFVLRKCFEENGFSVSGTILDDPAFKEIVIPNNFAINRCKVSYNTGVDSIGNPVGHLFVEHHGTLIHPQDHVPDMLIADFIIEVGKAFNLQFNINLRNMSVLIKQIQALSDFGSIVRLAESAFPEPNISYEEQDYNKGYEFEFDADVKDSAGDIKDDVGDYTPFRGSFRSLQDLVTGVFGPTLNSTAYVANENAMYKFDGEEWVFYTDMLTKYNTKGKDGTIPVKTKVRPMPMRFESVMLSLQYPVLGYYTGGGAALPFSQVGIQGRDLFVFNYDKLAITGTPYERMKPCFYTYSTGPLEYKKGEMPTIKVANWLGMQNLIGSSYTYPMLSSSSYTSGGTSTNRYTLSWNAPQVIGDPSTKSTGLYNVFWKNFAEQIQNGVAMEYEVQMDAITANSIDFNNVVIEIESLLFLCRKASLVSPSPSIAKLTLVRL